MWNYVDDHVEIGSRRFQSAPEKLGVSGNTGENNRMLVISVTTITGRCRMTIKHFMNVAFDSR